MLKTELTSISASLAENKTPQDEPGISNPSQDNASAIKNMKPKTAANQENDK
jgi:hypothetical protein